MFNIVLYEPEIPPNTGNIIRLCANTGASLHLIKPLGFELDNKKLRRAGLDYHEFTDIQVYENLHQCLGKFPASQVYAISTHGKKWCHEVNFKKNDILLFGPETRGLPEHVKHELSNESIIRIPMLPTNRSLNLSNAVSVVVYEAWRQLEFDGAT